MKWFRENPLLGNVKAVSYTVWFSFVAMFVRKKAVAVIGEAAVFIYFLRLHEMVLSVGI